MKEDDSIILQGGNMNEPVLRNNRVYKNVTPASKTIHALLKHVRLHGIDWVSESFGLNSDGKHVLSYIEGEVPHDEPSWLWDEMILLDIASRLRQWHEATLDFTFEEAQWGIDSNGCHEVICHNDFATYNCVFKDQKFAGLIDFDVCSPGTRLWDIAYTAYKFIPLRPSDDINGHFESPNFSEEVMSIRLQKFLKAYSQNDSTYLYNILQVTETLEKRLIALADWTDAYALQSQQTDLHDHAKMYRLHGEWIKSHF